MKILSEQKVGQLVQKYDELIPPVFESRKFPSDFELRPKDWALTDDVVHRPNVQTVIDEVSQKIRPLGTLDIEFASNRLVRRAKRARIDLGKRYPCGLKCPGCFSQELVYGKRAELLTWQEMMKVVDQGIDIGLTSTKFLGPGELLQNPDLFDILDAFENRRLPISIFTKGAELGSDDLAKKVFGDQGIETADELVKEVAKYDCVRILLGFNSFDSERQNAMVGSARMTQDYTITGGVFESRGVSNYTAKRDQALINLVNAGFSKDQRLSFVATPIGLHQIDEVPEMYLWAAKRNIPMVIGPTMESGEKAKGLMKTNMKLDPEHVKLVEMMYTVYATAIEHGITSIEKILEEGISGYMGTAPCNQVANGLYIRLNGQVQICPGNNAQGDIFGNTNKIPLAKIWKESDNYKLGPQTNNWCQAKRNGMPVEVQNFVLKALHKSILY